MKCTVKALRLGLQGTLEVENPLKEHILNPKVLGWFSLEKIGKFKKSHLLKPNISLFFCLGGWLGVEDDELHELVHFFFSNSYSSFTPDGATSQVIEMPDITCPEDFQVVICDLVQRLKKDNARGVLNPDLWVWFCCEDVILWQKNRISDIPTPFILKSFFSRYSTLWLWLKKDPFLYREKNHLISGQKISSVPLRSPIISQVWPGGAGERWVEGKILTWRGHWKVWMFFFLKLLGELGCFNYQPQIGEWLPVFWMNQQYLSLFFSEPPGNDHTYPIPADTFWRWWFSFSRCFWGYVIVPLKVYVSKSHGSIYDQQNALPKWGRLWMRKLWFWEKFLKVLWHISVHFMKGNSRFIRITWNTSGILFDPWEAPMFDPGSGKPRKNRGGDLGLILAEQWLFVEEPSSPTGWDWLLSKLATLVPWICWLFVFGGGG